MNGSGGRRGPAPARRTSLETSRLALSGTGSRISRAPAASTCRLNCRMAGADRAVSHRPGPGPASCARGAAAPRHRGIPAGDRVNARPVNSHPPGRRPRWRPNAAPPSQKLLRRGWQNAPPSTAPEANPHTAAGPRASGIGSRQTDQRARPLPAAHLNDRLTAGMPRMIARNVMIMLQATAGTPRYAQCQAQLVLCRPAVCGAGRSVWPDAMVIRQLRTGSRGTGFRSAST